MNSRRLLRPWRFVVEFHPSERTPSLVLSHKTGENRFRFRLTFHEVEQIIQCPQRRSISKQMNTWDPLYITWHSQSSQICHALGCVNFTCIQPCNCQICEQRSLSIMHVYAQFSEPYSRAPGVYDCRWTCRVQEMPAVWSMQWLPWSSPTSLGAWVRGPKKGPTHIH